MPPTSTNLTKRAPAPMSEEALGMSAARLWLLPHVAPAGPRPPHPCEVLEEDPFLHAHGSRAREHREPVEERQRDAVLRRDDPHLAQGGGEQPGRGIPSVVAVRDQRLGDVIDRTMA